MGERRFFWTVRFTDSPDGPGKDWSCVILDLGMGCPLSSILDCLWHPNGAKDAFGILYKHEMGRRRANPLSMSSVISLSISSKYKEEDL